MLLTEWLFLNQWKRWDDEVYYSEYANILKYVKPELSHPSLESLFNKYWNMVLTQSVPLVDSKVLRSRGRVAKRVSSFQDKVNKVIEYICNELGEEGRVFSLSTKFRYTDNIIKDRITSSQVSRSIDKLIREGKMIRVKEAWKWTSSKKLIHCAEYKLTPEEAI
jgi:hypothetical protein